VLLAPSAQLAEEIFAVQAGHFAVILPAHPPGRFTFAAEEGRIAGRAAAEYLQNGENASPTALTAAGNGISYVVPARLTLPAEKAELSFRVKRVFKKATLLCKQGERVICEKKRSIMLPGEMEKLTVPTDSLSPGELITVEVKEA